MTDDEIKTKLRQAIADSIPPAHCNGCDEWHCEHEERQDAENIEAVLEAVWEVIKGISQN